jgi:hypothetical protein
MIDMVLFPNNFVMKNLLIPAIILITFNLHSQIHVGLMGGVDLESEYTQFGMGLNYMPFPKISLGAMAMVTPFDGGDDYMIMYNAKYNIKKFTLVGGLMTGDMAMPGMMTGMNSSSHTTRMDSEPYFGIEFKPFKNRKLKIYYNYSDMMKSIGIMMPIINIGKMKMNHMNHMDHNHKND